MHVPGKQGDYGRFRNESKTVRGHRAQQRRLVVESEKNSLTSARGLLYGRNHGARRLRKFTLSRHLRAKLGEGFDRPQKPPDIVFLHRHAGWEQLPEQLESTTLLNAGRRWIVS